ncbi:F-box family protein [Striga asiatica]|uniref:F-box family protein n=1 Tax=Striga asiatica TaxID=4170 RepID=A0A5A7PCC7_STRAF|nr:F-box family protein [Striga asiatica]
MAFSLSSISLSISILIKKFHFSPKFLNSIGSYEMGSSFSVMGWSRTSAGDRSLGTGLGDLPESCVATVLAHLDPPQICRMAMLNRAFRGASSADFVWESKLPSNYGDVIGKVFEKDEGFCEGLCKRDIYSRLCRPNYLDGGTKKVWLDKSTGKTCMLISSNGLAITGIDDRRYWSRIPMEGSR